MNDQDLIARFSTDPEGAYHDLLEHYSPVILRMIRRFIQDQDEMMEVYTSICERFKANDYQALRRFRAAANLAPWLSIVVANACRDRFRKNKVTSVPQAVLDKLDERERLVFKYYYHKQLRHEDIAHTITSKHGMACTPIDVMYAIAKIDDMLTTGRRWFLLAALYANRPAHSIEVLREERGFQPARPPEADAYEEADEQRERVYQLNEALKQLEPDDRMLILLRFEHGMTAPQIADIMHFDNHRQVYTRLRTVFNRLRTIMTQ